MDVSKLLATPSGLVGGCDGVCEELMGSLTTDPL